MQFFGHPKSSMNMRSTIVQNLFLLVFMGGILTCQAQTGKMYPNISGEGLDRKPMTLPGDGMGKYTVVGMAHSKKAREALETWIQPVYEEFIDETGMAAMVYDVNVYLVLMFTGANKSAYESGRKQMLEGTDKELLPHVMMYKGPLAPYDEQLKFRDKSDPMIYVLDQEGKIIHVTYGMFTRKKLETIGNLVEN